MKVESLLRALFSPRRVAMHENEQRTLAGAVRSSVDVAGHSVPAWSWGSGPRVMLVHGWDSRGSHLCAFVPMLLEGGFSVTLYDAPGHGDAPGEMTSVVHMGRALLAVARHVGDVQALIGHSAGSAAALWAFGQGLEVRRSVHLSGPVTFEYQLLGAAQRASLTAEEYLAFRSRAAEFMGCPIEDMNADRLTKSLTHQGLILHDPEDPIVPFSESRDLHDRWPTSTLKAVRGVGHGRILIEPSVVADCAGFMGEST
jgi:pimeloyl-ACP methyl ester carboxylesterase